MARIDWTILNGFLQIEYFGRLPLLTYTPAGLDIEIDSITDEYLARLRQMTGTEADIQFLESRRDTPRPTLWKLLEKIEAAGDRAFIPVLTMWADHAPKKIRARIHALSAVLETAKESC